MAQTQGRLPAADSVLAGPHSGVARRRRRSRPRGFHRVGARPSGLRAAATRLVSRWLRQVATNRAKAFRKASRKRGQAAGDGEAERHLDQLEDPNSDLARQWDRDYDAHLLGKLLTAVRPDFEPATWQAFTRFALDGLTAAATAQELGVTESAVVQAKFRVLKRLREEAGDLMT